MLLPSITNIVSLIVIPIGLAVWTWKSTSSGRVEHRLRLIALAAAYVLLLLIGGGTGSVTTGGSS